MSFVEFNEGVAHMATEFFIIVPKRDDGKVYADVQKAVGGKLYMSNKDAQDDLDELGVYAGMFHVVPLIATTKEEYEEMK